MKRLLLIVVFVSSVLSGFAQDSTALATCEYTAKEIAHYMAPGWNLGNTMEAGDNANNFKNIGTSSETSWQRTRTSQAIIDFVKQCGFKSVRIPCAWVMGHITDKSTMTINEAWINRVKEIVDYCINDGLYVVLNDHWDGGWLEYDGFTTGANVETKKEQLRLLWTNIANAFKDYDEHLIFAGLNEPGVGGASPDASGSLIFNQYGSDDNTNLSRFVNRLYEYEQVFIDAVRATGGNNAKRILVVQGPSTNANRTYNCFDITKLTDSAENRLMLEVHHYDPYQFTDMTEDASWGKVYYYWYGHAPSGASDRTAPQSLQNTIQTNFNNLKTKFVDNGYPVIIGEYGCNVRANATNTNKHRESVQYWYNFSTDYCYEAGIIPFAWDTNNTSSPNMTIINRATRRVQNQLILDGINEGVTAGQAAFDTIYPESTTTGISSHPFLNESSESVYDLSGRQVSEDMTSLPGGIYIQGGKKTLRR